MVDGHMSEPATQKEKDSISSPLLTPNSAEVAALLYRVNKLNAADLKALIVAQGEARDVTWAAAWVIARRRAGVPDSEMVNDEKLAPKHREAWLAAWEAFADAAVAVYAKEDIPPEEFELLYAPWRSVVGDDE